MFQRKRVAATVKMGFFLLRADVLLLVLMFIRQIDGQCSSLPCFSQVPNNPTYGIAGRDILLPWKYNAQPTVSVNFQKWSILDQNGNIELNILQKSTNGFTEAGTYKGRTEFVENAGIILKTLNISDERYYQTTIDFNDGKAIVHKVFLNITVLPTLKVTLPSEVVAKEAESLSFFCEAEARPPPMIIWQLNGKTVNGSRFLVTTTVISSSAGLTHIRSTLQIKSLLPEDNGSLQCLVQIVTANLTSNTSLVVHYSPKNTQLSTNLPSNFVTTGGNANLMCNAVGLPAPYFQFYKGSTIIQNTTSNMYTISSAKTSDEAIYECVPVNFLGEGPRSNLTILVRVPPTFLQRPGDTTPVLLHSSVSLACVIYGEPQPMITWEKVNGSLPASATITNRTVSENATFAVTESVLTVPRVAKEDYGLYQCKGTNDVGMVTHNTILDVQFVPTINATLGQATPIVQDAGKNASWACTFEGNPDVTVAWYLNGNKITGGGFTIERITLESTPQYVVVKSILTMVGILHQKAGNLTCNGTNSAGHVGAVTKIIIEYAPLFSNVLPVTENVVEGNTTSITCVARGQPRPHIYWMREGTILSGGRYTISFMVLSSTEFSSEVTSTLTVKDLTKSDHGSYICMANNTIGPNRQSTTLVLLYAPYFLRPVQSTYKVNEEYQSFTLKCHFRANPGATVTWLKDGNTLTSADNVTIATSNVTKNETGTETLSVVTMPIMQKSHFGMYRCVVENSIGNISVATQVIVEYKPFLLNSAALSQTKNVTENTTFVCRVQSSPISNITWTTKHSPQPFPSHYSINTVIVSSTLQHAIVESTLHINNLTREDFGDIACLADNKVGQIKRDYSLAVQYPPTNTTTVPVQVIKVEGTTNYIITLTYTAFPAPEIGWYINGTKANTSSHTETVSQSRNMVTTTTRFTISHVSRTSIGMYSCSASNLLGESTQAVTLVVLYPPTFLQGLPLTVVRTEKDSVQFQCDIISNPVSTIVWLLEQKEETNSSQKIITARDLFRGVFHSTTTSTLHITSLNKTNSGNYSCQATNSVDKTIKTIELIVHYSAEVTPNFNAVTNISETFSAYTFECLIEASPAPKVYWTREGTLFTTGVTTTVTEDLGHRTRVHTTITFPNGIKRSNYGRYSCHADNTVSNVSKSTTANVWYVPEFLKNLTDRVNKTASGNVTLVCEIQGHPQPNIEWRKGNTVITTGFTTEVISQQPTNTELRSTLMLTSVDKTETGNYVCMATNIAGTKQMATYVDVQYVPRPAQTKYDITINASLPFVLDCAVDANPPVQTYHWWKNGVQQSQIKTSSISVASSSETDTGVYVCLPINPVGAGSNITFDLKVRYLPKVTKAVSCKLTTKANNTKVYECICGGEGYPTPEIRWTKFGSSNVLARGTTLNVTVEQGIDGTYECRIQNSQGEVVSNIQIIVYNDQYGQWTDYGSCNATCGGGIQTRTRTCNVLPCTALLSETRTCNIAACGAFVANNQENLLFLYVLIPIFLFLLIFIIVWLARVNRSREDQEPIVVPVNNNLSKPPSVRSMPTKREIYLPENNFGVLNAGYRPDGDLVNGMVKKERDTVEVEMHFGNEPPESDTDPVEVAVPATESPSDTMHYRNGFTPVSDIPESPEYIPVPEYDFVSPGSQRNRPQEIESWLGPNVDPVTRQNGDEDDFYTAL